jgi:ABC-type sugar transport system ATPase subunit
MAKVVLNSSDVAKRFGPTIALERVKLELRRGEVQALIRENGCD